MARRVGMIALLLLSRGLALPAQTAVRPDEYRLKAAFVYRFPQFVEWPSSSPEGRQAIQICVSRPSPFGKTLHELFAGETLNGRTFLVREIDDTGDAVDACHVLFVSGSGSAVQTLLDRVASAPVLTVGDSDGFRDRGGIITLRIADGRLRFEVNATAAERAGLRLSSQLLRVALAVRGAAA